MISKEILEQHVPVLLDETIRYLNCQSEGVYIDGTIGLGGHSEKILEATAPGAVLIGIDLDSECLSIAQERLSKYGDRVLLVQGNFCDMDIILREKGFKEAQGILLDIGMNSYHLRQNRRGFSFNDAEDAPLDMRFDRNCGPAAADIVNRYRVHDLEKIFRDYGEERWSGRIARAIERERKKEQIATVGQLVKIIVSAIPHLRQRPRIHPATRTFQALRIEVNRELDNLQKALDTAIKCLHKGGRLCVISFHSLEDRIVKHTFKEAPGLRIITKKPLVASSGEKAVNPRARSAKMRVAERC